MIVEYSDLAALRKKHAEQKIVFCSGSYDLPHLGHVFFFEESRKKGDLLIVSVGQDAEIKKNKGPHRPVLSEDVRIKTVDALKPVDYAFLTNRPGAGESWLGPIWEILEILRPDVYVVNSDAGDIEERREIAKRFEAEFVILDAYAYSAGIKISTTYIISKIQSLLQSTE